LGSKDEAISDKVEDCFGFGLGMPVSPVSPVSPAVQLLENRLLENRLLENRLLENRLLENRLLDHRPSQQQRIFFFYHS
jgi:hypothetical protein